jgi:drug/metabolite transporter (DMT)-like permease
VSIAAYGIALWAMTRGSLAHVAALRETSVIFAALIGTALLGERFGAARALAATLVAAGLALMNFLR